MSKEINFRTKLDSILNALSLIKRVRQTEQVPPGTEFPAIELYQIIEDLIQDLIFLVRSKHYRSARKNPGIRIKINLTSEDEGISNPMKKVVFPHYLVEPYPKEIQELEIILQDLESLKRNRTPLRSAKLMPGSSSVSKRKRRGKPRKASGRKFKWWY